MVKASAAAALLLACSLLAYSNSFQADFHFDDHHQIVKNHHLRDLRNIPRFFVDARLGSYQAEQRGYRPVTYATFALNYALSGYRVFGYHLFNFLLHAANALLVLSVVTVVLRDRKEEDTFHPALFAALAFALHPIQTGAVSYISGRAVLLATFFCLSSFLAFTAFRRAGKAGGKVAALAISVLLFLAGLLSKEMAVSLPALLVVYDVVLTSRRKEGLLGTFRSALFYTPYLAVIVATVVIKKLLQGFVAVKTTPFGTAEYLLSQSKVVLLYLRLLVLPVRQNADYDLPLTRSVDPAVVLAAAAIAAAFVMLLALRRRRPCISFFGLWFIVALAPESSLVPITDLAVEYRLYLPSVGFVACGALLLFRVLRRRALRFAAAAAVLVPLGLLTWSRNLVWASELSLWRDVAEKAPYSARAHSSLGRALYLEGRHREAAEALEKALKMAPAFPQRYGVHNNLGLAYMDLGLVSEALPHFREAIRLYPDFMEAHQNLGRLFNRLGRHREAVTVLMQAVRLAPGDPDVRAELATAYLGLGDRAKALEEGAEAVRYAPRSFVAHYNLAVLYDLNGMAGEAREEARRALELAREETDRARGLALADRLK